MARRKHLDVTQSYRDAQTRIRQINDEIEKARTFLECGASEPEHYEGTSEHIERLQEEKERIKSHWDDQ